MTLEIFNSRLTLCVLEEEGWSATINFVNRPVDE